MAFAIMVVELRHGPKTIEKKDELKQRGFCWIPGLAGKGWVKEAETLEEAKDIIRGLHEMGFGAGFGVVIKGTFYDHRMARDLKGIDIAEEAREIYRFINELTLGRR
ncbi:MAG: hypothetical protein H5U02_00525 [Clostridia bacterium]|nr:hypothetical protein [Clostridia bacterium]